MENNTKCCNTTMRYIDEQLCCAGCGKEVKQATPPTPSGERDCKHSHTGENMLLGDYCYDCKQFISGVIKEAKENRKW